MRVTTRLYLRCSEWPRADKALWQQAFEPKPDLFDGGGPGAHLSERSVQQLQYAYGNFLCFISAEHGDLLRRTPVRRLNARIIEEYINWQPKTCGGVTLSVYLYHLWLALCYLCPRNEWRWLLIISKRIKAQAKPKPEKHHLVTSATLYKLYNTVRRRTHKALGFPIDLHRFRRAAATFWSIRDPANVRGAKDLLGHASFATTEKYYLMSQSRLAGRVLETAISHMTNGVPASSDRNASRTE